MEKTIHKRSGFTLIEVIIALAIITILVIPISSMFLSTLKLLQASKLLMTYSQLGQQYMERSKYDFHIAPGNYSYDIEDHQMRIEVSIEPLTRTDVYPNLERIQLIVRDFHDNRELARMVGLRRRK
jgi:prepilin-type N-terminal cleavage/methylation domain-containing protein